jgi:hypothetical protein
VTEKFLDGIYVCPFIKKIRSKRMTEDMRRLSSCNALDTPKLALHNSVHIRGIKSPA